MRIPLVLTATAGETGEVTVSVEVRSALGGSTTSDTFVVDLGSTKPSAPTNVVGVAGNRQVSLKWTAPASTGASAITDYGVLPASLRGMACRSC